VGSDGGVVLIGHPLPRPLAGGVRAPQFALTRLACHARSRPVRVACTAGSAILALALAAVAVRYFAETSWPLFRAHPGLIVAAGVLSLLGYVFKAYGWRQLFATNERPDTLALAAANGGASITALALPGRFDDVVRIAIIRRFQRPRTSVSTLCLSLGMLGLIDSAALAPFALTGALLPSHSLGVRLGLLLLAAVGFAAAALVLGLPRLTRSRHFHRFRFGRWLSSRTTSLQPASAAWTLVSASWLARTGGLVVLLGALGVGFSLTLALLYLCASSAAAALPIGPGGTAMQAGGGAAVLIASGVGIPEAVGVAVAVQLVGILVGGSIFLGAAAWRAGRRLTPHHRAAPVLAS
jgi:uncharacterized membrane protein YbhN (UPF0104 family)